MRVRGLRRTQVLYSFGKEHCGRFVGQAARENQRQRIGVKFGYSLNEISLDDFLLERHVAWYCVQPPPHC
jgi:hypothetical protein